MLKFLSFFSNFFFQRVGDKTPATYNDFLGRLVVGRCKGSGGGEESFTLEEKKRKGNKRKRES